MKSASSTELLHGHRPTETLPLNDYIDKSERLQKTHAQSSAETRSSGLGDSLQRIHTLSSTETSGYGDAFPSPSAPPSPSPENTLNNRSGHIAGVHADSRFRSSSKSDGNIGEDNIKARTLPSESTPTSRIRSGIASVYHSALDLLPASLTGGSSNTSAAATGGGISNPADHLQHHHQTPGGTGNNSSSNMGRNRGQVAAQDARDLDGFVPPSSFARNPTSRSSGRYNNDANMYSNNPNHHNNQQDEGYMEEPENFDNLFEKSASRSTNRGRNNAVGNNGVGVHGAYPDGNNYGVNYSPGNTPPLSTRRSSLFLGGSDSTWLKWSQDRRASFKKRLDNIERRQKDVESKRVTTPVKKARKESLMFVSPELESEHIPKENDLGELALIGLALPADSEQTTTLVPMSAKKKKQLEAEQPKEVKLTINQWNTLIDFWEHDCFIRCRYAGMVLCFLALILTVISSTSREWSKDFDPEWGEVHYGLWLQCMMTKGIATNCTLIYERDWQNAVIGLLIFSVAFGFLACILSICGVCTSNLPKKIYYYHSAGEIYFICALSSTIALIVYPLAIESSGQMTDHSYGFGYGLGWTSTLFFFAASMCMCLDDVVRAHARGCCGCGGSSKRHGNTRV